MSRKQDNITLKTSFPLPTSFFNDTTYNSNDNEGCRYIKIEKINKNGSLNNSDSNSDYDIKFVETLSEMYAWIPHETNVAELAQIVNDNSKIDIVTVSTSQGFKTLPRSQLTIADVSHFRDVDDLCEINNLNEAPILNILGNRLKRGYIYSYVGNMLISLNPFTTIPNLYEHPLKYYMETINNEEDDDDDETNLMGKVSENDKDRDSNVTMTSSPPPPHVYGISSRAFKALSKQNEEDFVARFSTTATNKNKENITAINEDDDESGNNDNITLASSTRVDQSIIITG